MKLRYLPALLVLASLALIAAPRADAGYYIGGTFGHNFSDNYGGTAVFGLDDPNMPLRFELEFTYRYEDKDRVFVDFKGFQSGEMHLLGPMGNIFYDYHNKTAITPYVGIGGGYVLIDQASQSDWVLAYQFMIGGALELSNELDLLVGYRYFETHKAPDLRGIQTQRYKKHLLEAGLRYRF